MMSTDNCSNFIDRNAFEKYSIAHRSIFSHLCDVLPLPNPSSDKPNGPQLRSNVNVKAKYIPTESHRKSSLTSSEQSLYIKLHLKCSKSRVSNSTTETDKSLYAQLHKKVQNEQKEFLRLAEKCETKKAIVYTVNEEVNRFATEYDRCCYERSLKYPRFYSIKDQVPLMMTASSFRTTVTNFQMVRTVLEMGLVPRLIFPKMTQTKPLVNQNYDKITSRYPIAKENEPQDVLFKTPVSKDINAEKLAVKYGSQIVISSSGLKTLFANGESCLENEWVIPAVVKQFDGNTTTHRIVFIDKPFRNPNASIFDDNLKYQKRALKSSVTHPKHLSSYFFKGYKQNASEIGSKLPTEDHNVNETEIEKNVIDSDLSTKVGELTKLVSSKSEEDLLEISKERSSAVPTRSYEPNVTSENESDDEKLVIDDCGSEQMAKEPSSADMKAQSCTELDDETKSTLHSPPQVRRSLRLQNKSSDVSTDVSAMPVAVVVEENSELCTDRRNKRKLHEFNSSPSKRKLKSVNSEPPPPLSTLDEIEELQTKMFRDIHKTNPNKKISGSEPIATDSEKENSDDYLPPMTDSNVTYGLWKMGKLDLLIRSSVDGFSFTTVQIQPILEYWSSIGGQLLSFTECARQWIGTKIKPNSSLTRVRINAFNYEVVSVEEMDIHQTTKVTSGFHPKDSLDFLDTILQRLLLLPKGNYLLKHESGEGVCNILKEVDKNVNCDPSLSVFDLHEYRKAAMTSGHSMSETIPWTPIDTNAFLFRHFKLNRVPVTFEPKSAPGISKSKKINRKGKK